MQTELQAPVKLPAKESENSDLSRSMFETLAHLAAQTNKDGFASALTRSLAESLSVRCVFLTEVIQSGQVRVLANWLDGKLQEGGETDLADTVCKMVIDEKKAHLHTKDLAKLLPDHVGKLKEVAKAYLGVPVMSTTGKVMGHLAIVDDQPMGDTTNLQTYLEAFAAQAAADAERRRIDEALHAVVEATASSTGSDFFRSLVKHLTRALQLRHAFIATCNNQKTAVRMLAFWVDHDLAENTEYGLKGTPCRKVIEEGAICYHPQEVQALFPEDQDLVALEAESYIGVPIFDSSNNVIGHLVVLDDKKMVDAEPAGLSLLKLFAARAGAEMERINAEEALRSHAQELQKAIAMAREASRLKSEFLANMSHELRTPLNAIIAFTEIMLAGMTGEVNEKQHHKLERVHLNSKRLLSLINDLLDLAKIEAGRVEISAAPFSPSNLALSLKAQMEGLAEKKGLVFEVKIDPVLPTMLLGDAGRIEQVLGNLLSNAIKFTEKGRVELKMENESDDQWRLSVSDTGIGLPPHALEFIFDEFRQLDGTSQRAYGGTGLGLAIARNLCRMMDGEINATSKLGEGSTFTVTLPRRIAPEQEAVALS